MLEWVAAIAEMRQCCPPVAVGILNVMEHDGEAVDEASLLMSAGLWNGLRPIRDCTTPGTTSSSVVSLLPPAGKGAAGKGAEGAASKGTCRAEGAASTGPKVWKGAGADVAARASSVKTSADTDTGAVSPSTADQPSLEWRPVGASIQLGVAQCHVDDTAPGPAVCA